MLTSLLEINKTMKESFDNLPGSMQVIITNHEVRFRYVEMIRGEYSETTMWFSIEELEALANINLYDFVKGRIQNDIQIWREHIQNQL